MSLPPSSTTDTVSRQHTPLRFLLRFLGACAAIVPAFGYFVPLGPPLLPSIAIVTAFASAFVLLRRIGRDDDEPRGTRGSMLFVLLGLLLIAAYRLAFDQWTVGPPANRNGPRIQIGFALMDGSLTEAAKATLADRDADVHTPEELMLAFGAYPGGMGRTQDVWKAWSIQVAGLALILAYFLGFLSLTAGLAALIQAVDAEQRRREPWSGRLRRKWTRGRSPEGRLATDADADALHRKRLVVVVPAITGRLREWEPLLEELSRDPKLKDAHWLKWDHGARWYGRESASALALRLHARIEGEWARSGGYEEVVLIGHSLGGLLVRQAYLLALGVGTEPPQASPWSAKVSRILLFAAPNRGIDRKTRWPWILPTFAVLNWAFRVLPLKRFLVRDLMSGSDFITNLRIQWIRRFDALGNQAPLVIQLLGDRDGLVRREDSIDVEQFRTAWHITISDATHGSLFRLVGVETRAERYALIRKAVVEDNLSVDGNTQNITVGRGHDHYVFVLHGIRARNGKWVAETAEALRKLDPKIGVIQSGYGYLSAFRFALPPTRRKNLSWFQDQYSDCLARNPKARFSFIGHSNATYLLGESLKRIPGMRFERVALVGSVLPVDYPWQERFRAHQVQLIRNDRSNRDIPVAVLCSALRGLRMKDVGTGGFHGFPSCSDPGKCEVYWHDGDHSRPLNSENLSYLAEFAVAGTIRQPATMTKEDPKTLDSLSRCAPILALGIVLGLLGLAVWWVAFDPSFDVRRFAGVLGIGSFVFLLLDLI